MIVVLHGAGGGGLELAAAAHIRVANAVRITPSPRACTAYSSSAVVRCASHA